MNLKKPTGLPGKIYRKKLALSKLADNGVWVCVRIQPFLFPLENINHLPIKLLAEIGAKHITLEHLRIPTNSTNIQRQKLFENLGINILDEYKNMGVKKSRINYELDSKFKIKNILYLRARAHEYGLSFGAADNDFHHFSDQPCCCGLPNSDYFINVFKGNFTNSILNSFQESKINFENISKEWYPKGSIREFINSDCRQNNKIEIIDYLKLKLENPHSSNSPLMFFGLQSNR